MIKIIQRAGKILVGTVLVFFGIIGLLIPIIPGVLPILIGAALISPSFRHKLAAFIHYLREKWKKYKEDRSI